MQIPLTNLHKLQNYLIHGILKPERHSSERHSSPAQRDFRHQTCKIDSSSSQKTIQP